ncbi:hypothetical protein DY000_02013628 [Brassica cretica]|uniref:Uncharacterized protein n=1 Tax=Brassica cretica TaxID=69181 RepID=A0ABQ7D792_BRACR|nr:hypothetical protein DY000_02013628 [Brassica cretica]
MECHQITSSARCSHSPWKGKQLTGLTRSQPNKEQDRSKSVNSIDDLAAKVDQLLKGNQSQVFIMEEAAAENNVSDATTEGDNTNKEQDRSKSVNSIDDLAAKVDQLLKGNQSQVFIMEEAAAENNVSDATTEGDNTVDDQQEVSYVNGQGWQYENYHPNPNVRNSPHLFSYPMADNPVNNAQNSQGQNSGYQKPYQGRTYVLSQAQHNQFQNQTANCSTYRSFASNCSARRNKRVSNHDLKHLLYLTRNRNSLLRLIRHLSLHQLSLFLHANTPQGSISCSGKDVSQGSGGDQV